MHRPLTAPCSGPRRRQPVLCYRGRARGRLAVRLGAQVRAILRDPIRDHHARSSLHDKCSPLGLGHLARRATLPPSTRARISCWQPPGRVSLPRRGLQLSYHRDRWRAATSHPGDGPRRLAPAWRGRDCSQAQVESGSSRQPVTCWQRVPPWGHSSARRLDPSALGPRKRVAKAIEPQRSSPERRSRGERRTAWEWWLA